MLCLKLNKFSYCFIDYWNWDLVFKKLPFKMNNYLFKYTYWLQKIWPTLLSTRKSVYVRSLARLWRDFSCQITIISNITMKATTILATGTLLLIIFECDKPFTIVTLEYIYTKIFNQNIWTFPSMTW